MKKLIVAIMIIASAFIISGCADDGGDYVVAQYKVYGTTHECEVQSKYNSRTVKKEIFYDASDGKVYRNLQDVLTGYNLPVELKVKNLMGDGSTVIGEIWIDGVMVATGTSSAVYGEIVVTYIVP